MNIPLSLLFNSLFPNALLGRVKKKKKMSQNVDVASQHVICHLNHVLLRPVDTAAEMT